MAGEEDEVIVSLPADTSTVQITKVADAPVRKAVDSDDPVESLKGQFAAMTARATAAEAEAQTATQRLTETRQRLQATEQEVVTSQLDTVLSGLAGADAEAEAAEREFAAAFEVGDGPAQARAQRKIAGAEARKVRLQEAKEDLEDAAKRRPARAEPEPPVRRQPTDVVEAFVAKMSPKSAAFIRANPDTVTNPKLNARMLAAHNLAVADDVAIDSDEYFRRIEDGIKPGAVRKTEDTKSNGDGRRPSSAAAPAGGGGGGLNGGGVEVRLTKGEAQAATDGTLVWNYDSPDGKFKKGEPLGLAEFARRKLEGKKAGLYDRNNIEV